MKSQTAKWARIRQCLLWGIGSLGLLGMVAPAQAQRVALLIGNASYSVGRLANPLNDVNEMEASLNAIGFRVQKVLNANQNEMKRAVRNFGNAAQGAEVAFVYYSGHGAQLNGENYLLPLSAQIDKESDYPIEAVAANDVLAQIRGAQPKAAILVLDACRDNPLAVTTKTATKGLGRMSAPTGTMIAFATAPGDTASDNGHYARVLARELRRPGQELVDVFRNTAAEVRRLSAGGKPQDPRISEMSIHERLYLAGQGTQIASLRPEPVPAPVAPMADPEQEAWELAKRRDTVAGYQAYINRYSQGRFVDPARVALEGLQPRPSPAVSQAAAQPVQQARSSAPGVALGSGQAFRDCQGAHCPELVVIPAGRFTMGNNDGETAEKPTRTVDVSRFALGKYEVTQGQWKAVMGSNPSRFKECGDDCPVESVSWNGIQRFLQRLNEMTGQRYGYRLPSEAEWEYAARAGTTTKYWWGDKASRDHANYGKDQCCDGHAEGRDRWVNTAPVGQFPANPFGLHDMHGNVLEWVQDVWHDNYAGAPPDASAWVSGGDQTRRVLRGGSWVNYQDILRSAYRSRNSPDFANDYGGFRIASSFP